MDAYKRQWLEECVERGIKSREEVDKEIARDEWLARTGAEFQRRALYGPKGDPFGLGRDRA